MHARYSRARRDRVGIVPTMSCTYVVTETWERFVHLAASLCRWEAEAPATVLEHLLFGGETVERASLAGFLDEIARGETALGRSGASGWLIRAEAAPRRALALFDGEVLWRGGAGACARGYGTGAKFFLGEREVDATTFQSLTGTMIRQTKVGAVFTPTLGVLRAAATLAQQNGTPLRFLHVPVR